MQFCAQLWLGSNERLGTSTNVWLRFSVFLPFLHFDERWLLLAPSPWALPAVLGSHLHMGLIRWWIVLSWHYGIAVSAPTVTKLLLPFSLTIKDQVQDSAYKYNPVHLCHLAHIWVAGRDRHCWQRKQSLTSTAPQICELTLHKACNLVFPSFPWVKIPDIHNYVFL